MQEEIRRERDSPKQAQAIYVCPECGKPFENVSATETHLHDTYELHLKAWHGKLHDEAHGKDLSAKIT